ncbi:MAG: hypothetical protein WCC03_09510 [Candidatus Acidiferrales bacterium]
MARVAGEGSAAAFCFCFCLLPFAFALRRRSPFEISNFKFEIAFRLARLQASHFRQNLIAAPPARRFLFPSHAGHGFKVFPPWFTSGHGFSRATPGAKSRGFSR